MKLVVLLSSRDKGLRAIKDHIPEEYTILESEFGPKSLQLLKKIAAGIIIIDTTVRGAQSWLEKACKSRPDLTYLGIGAEVVDEFPGKYFYDYICSPFNPKKVRKVLGRAWERIQLRLELGSLQKKTISQNGKNAPVKNSSTQAQRKERVLCDFSRALGNNFNQKRLLELFMDSVAELLPVGKMSILLDNENRGTYKISAQRGLDIHFFANLSFNSSSGLVDWLTEEGRILVAGESSDAGGLTGEALQEMQLLHSVVAIPLIAHGRLVGILNLGPKVTGAPFYEEELEILYILCGNVAMALRDIDLHHQVANQKLYIESILQRMNSGVVAINRDNCIITLNYRAGELLSLAQQETMGRDLRFLPSPLGDLLYETLTTGKQCLKEEIELAKGRIPLEITTYQLLNPGGEVLGSVMIFDDITSRKQLEAERRQADQLDVLNKFVSQLAHEIKNPMVAIQTFSELLTDKYDDSSFREFFTYTVKQEIKRLNELVEQLIAFSAPLSYKYSSVDIHEILDLGLMLLQEQGMGQETAVKTAYCSERLPVRADKTVMARAFSYLFYNSFRAVENGGELHISTSHEKDLFFNGGVRICLRDSQTKAGKEDVEKMFDPLCVRRNGYISLGLPVSRKIIEDHGGRIKASLTKDKSLEFEISLPIISEEEGGGDSGKYAQDTGS